MGWCGSKLTRWRPLQAALLPMSPNRQLLFLGMANFDDGVSSTSVRYEAALWRRVGESLSNLL